MFQLLKNVVERNGGQSATANRLRSLRPESKIRQGHVRNWIYRDERLPPEWILPLCEVDAWQVTPHELRPDIYPHPHDGLPVEMREAA